MKRLLVLSTILVSTSAFAGERNHGGYGSQLQFQNQHQLQRQNAYGGAGGAGGNALSSSSASSTGGSVLNSGNNYYRNRYPAASAYAPSVALGGGNVCGSQFSGGIQTFGFGFSLGIPIEQTQCTYRENAKVLTVITGSRRAGMLVLAQEPGMRAALAGAGLIVEPTYDYQTGQWVYPQRVRRAR